MAETDKNQGPDLNLIETLQQDPKRAVHKRMPTSVIQLKRCCKEERAVIPPQRRGRLIQSCRKQLLQVLAARGGATSGD